MCSSAITIQDLIAQAGAKLADNMRAGYDQGHERTLADWVFAQMAAAGLTADGVLDELVAAHLDSLIMVDCLLDECNEGSYTTTRAMAGLLCAEIRRQGGQADAVRELVLDGIVAEVHLAQSLAALKGAVTS